ncbi:hypothetical protein [Nitrososphaera viennensis]|uniref:Uncharacterized protein n=2 Tax=Nitrososphaera viennensis TaxID=1034015 RepID=A0A060HVH2_9ARCH|nr:hypothetical protein [Nitrososphaera viennensis]AIC17042.1 hypothetical protein NVIE_027660 [Nitrososphaera viennensis EN76]UVS68938.1 hypothetical protein NWT39_13655 [Nitrososphaera viennensis]
MALQRKVRGGEGRGKLDKRITTTDCELIERDPFTGQVIRSERHEILLKENRCSISRSHICGSEPTNFK